MAKSKQSRIAVKEQAKKHNEPAIDNRRARHEYHILDSLEAGLALTGTEVKAIRAGGVSLNEAYARFRDGEAWLMSMHIPPYKQGSFSNVDPNRPRKLLLHKEQIADLQSRVKEKGLDHRAAAYVFHARQGEGAARRRARQEVLGQARGCGQA